MQSYQVSLISTIEKIKPIDFYIPATESDDATSDDAIIYLDAERVQQTMLSLLVLLSA